MAIDNTQWILIHLYVVHEWKKFPSSIVLKQLVYISHLTTFYCMVKSLHDFGGLRLEDLEGVIGYDGIDIFQGNWTNAMLQFKDKFAYF